MLTGLLFVFWCWRTFKNAVAYMRSTSNTLSIISMVISKRAEVLAAVQAYAAGVIETARSAAAKISTSDSGNDIRMSSWEFTTNNAPITLASLNGPLKITAASLSGPTGCTFSYYTSSLCPTARGEQIGAMMVGASLNPSTYTVDEPFDELMIGTGSSINIIVNTTGATMGIVGMLTLVMERVNYA